MLSVLLNNGTEVCGVISNLGCRYTFEALCTMPKSPEDNAVAPVTVPLPASILIAPLFVESPSISVEPSEKINNLPLVTCADTPVTLLRSTANVVSLVASVPAETVIVVPLTTKVSPSVNAVTVFETIVGMLATHSGLPTLTHSPASMPAPEFPGDL